MMKKANAYPYDSALVYLQYHLSNLLKMYVNSITYNGKVEIYAKILIDAKTSFAFTFTVEDLSALILSLSA
jgi:hypothetical protein